MKQLFTYLLTIISISAQHIQKDAYLFEYGHFDINQQAITDTTIPILIKIDIDEDYGVTLFTENRQIYKITEKIIYQEDTKVKYTSHYAMDIDGKLCNLIIFTDKLEDIIIVCINYKDFWIKYYL